MGERRCTYRILVARSEGKKPLGRPRRRWGYKNGHSSRVIGGGAMDWMDAAQDRGGWRAVLNAVMNFRVP